MLNKLFPGKSSLSSHPSADAGQGRGGRSRGRGQGCRSLGLGQRR